MFFFLFEIGNAINDDGARQIADLIEVLKRYGNVDNFR